MGKSKRARSHGPVAGGGGQPKKTRKMHTFSKLSTSTAPSSNVNKNNPKKNPSQLRPIVPFGKRDRILLIGEGDFSFARSLATQHRCRDVLATCYDSKETLFDKYPQAERNVDEILNAFPAKKTHDGAVSTEKEEGPPQEQSEQPSNENSNSNNQKQAQRHGPNVLFSVDARKLGLAAGGGKDIRTGFSRRERKRPAWIEAKMENPSSSAKGGPWDIICFNFPHVGGLSTDVNRQVRANQELLVAFFKACVPLLSSRPEIDGAEGENDDNDDEWDLSSNDESDSEDEGNAHSILDSTLNRTKSRFRTEPGQILVTMFEGEPYTLWNIKDLARHAGLRVVTSFRFPWASYNEYSHARTIGEIEGKHGGKGGWKGEDREARMYVFEVKQENHSASTGNSTSLKKNPSVKKKRSRDASDSEESD